MIKKGGKFIRLIVSLVLTMTVISFSYTSLAVKPEKTGKPDKDNESQSEVERAHNYLASQVKGIGLINSHNDDSCSSFTYDNAIAVIAFVAMEDYNNARTILNTFKSGVAIPARGGYNDVHDYETGVRGGPISAGPNAWLLNAVNFYYYKTGDAQFQSLGRQLADYLVFLQDINGGLYGGEFVTWKSAEQNQAAYAGLCNFGTFIGDGTYIESANLIRDFLITECWDGERFWRGERDRAWVTDVQALGVLSLGTSYASALYWAEDHTKCTHRLGRWKITGFDFDYDLDTVWFEGTLQMAMAFKRNYDDGKALYYYDNVKKTQRNNGSFLCATNEGTTGTDWTLMPIECVAPACWFIFCETQTNPLMR